MSAKATICVWLVKNPDADGFTAGEEILKALRNDGYVVVRKELIEGARGLIEQLAESVEHMGGSIGRLGTVDRLREVLEGGK